MNPIPMVLVQNDNWQAINLNLYVYKFQMFFYLYRMSSILILDHPPEILLSLVSRSYHFDVISKSLKLQHKYILLISEKQP